MSVPEVEVTFDAKPSAREGMFGDAYVQETPDGVIVDFSGNRPDPDEGRKLEAAQVFNANLAELISPGELTKLAMQIKDWNDADEKTRADWRARRDRGLEMLGIKEVVREKIVENASSAVHPMLAEALVQFNARAIAEYFPPSGPVKVEVIGRVTREREKQAKRVETYMNYYLTAVDRGYFEDTDQLLFRLPLDGSMFRAAQKDYVTSEVRARQVTSENFVASYEGMQIEDLQRYGIKYPMSGSDIARAVARGEFIKPTIPLIANAQDNTPQDSSDKVADVRTVSTHQDDENFQLYDYYIEARFKGIDDGDAPEGVNLHYRVTVDLKNQQVYAIYRNWEEGKPEKRIDWVVHYKFLPGLGFYGFGYPHVIGGLIDASTDTIRALLDSAQAANFQGGFMLKDSRIEGPVRLKYGEWTPLDMAAEDLQKSFFTPPFKEPSTALFQVLGLLTEAGRRVMSTTEAVVGDADNRGPVGTTIALIEEGMKVFSAVHRRMHVSARREFEMIANLLHEALKSGELKVPDLTDDDDEPMFPADQATLIKLIEDLDGRIDILPVSDPNIVSNTQRIALAQAVLMVMEKAPMDFGPDQRRAGYEFMFESMKVPNFERFLPKQLKARYLDPVSENYEMMTGKAVKAFENQEHDAHMAIHGQFAQVAQATLPPELLGPATEAFAAHMREHLALKYRQQIMAVMGIPLPPVSEPDEDGDEDNVADLPPEIELQLSQQQALAIAQLQPPQAQPGGPDEAAAEIDRKDKQAAADIARKDALALHDERRKDAAHEADLARQREAHSAGLQMDATRDMASTLQNLASAKREEDNASES